MTTTKNFAEFIQSQLDADPTLKRNVETERVAMLLATYPTPSTKHMGEEERADGISQMLCDLDQLASSDGCIAAAWASEFVRCVAMDDKTFGFGTGRVPRKPFPLIAVCSRQSVMSVRHVRPHVIISITDPPPFGDGKRIPFEPDEQIIDILHLSFADFHEKHFAIEHEGKLLKQWAMEPWHASCVKEFLDNHAGKYETIIVHCEAGVSRSPSMALAIAEHLGVDRYEIEPVTRNWDAQPLNPWVYKTTKMAFQCNR